MVVFHIVLAALGYNVRAIDRSNASRKTRRLILRHVRQCIVYRNGSEDHFLVQFSRSKVNTLVNKNTVHLLGYGGALLNIIKRPTSTKIAERAEYQQLYRRRLLVVVLHPTPAVEEGFGRQPLHKLPEIGIR
jgi:hypothetical protein